MKWKWITASRQLSQGARNMQRLRQIASVLGRHNLAHFLHRMQIGQYLPGQIEVIKESKADKSLPRRVREAFEELGPTFVKLGQLLSTRTDLLDQEWTDELKLLQDHVKELPFATIRQVIESELEVKVEEAFEWFSKEPLAAASIAQVHEATLLSGESVVVKIQRPEIEDLLEQDISLMGWLARLLEKYIPETRVVQPTVIIDEFFRTLALEIDFVVEANNIKRISENMKSIPEVVIPHVYEELSTSKILTLEKLDGVPANNINEIEKLDIDRKFVVQIGARAFFKAVLVDGLFHGDLHGGNVFILPDNRLGIIDFGIVGRLSQKSRDLLGNMVLSLLNEDYENLCYQYVELSQSNVSIDFEGFQREIRSTLSPYIGLHLADLNTGRILMEATRIAVKYNIQIPGDWMLVFKAIFTMEGMARGLDPNFDMIATGQELVKSLLKSQYSVQRFSKEALWILKDLGSLIQVLPRQVRWMFRKFNSNDFAFEIKIPELQSIKEQLSVNSKRSALAIMIAGLFIAASLALDFDHDYELWGIPAFALGLFALAVALLFRFFIL